MANNNKIYETFVLKDKQEDFLKFLRSLEIQKDELDFNSNGDYFRYKIDLSKKSDSSYLHIKRKLNDAQVEFL